MNPPARHLDLTRPRRRLRAARALAAVSALAAVVCVVVATASGTAGAGTGLAGTTTAVLATDPPAPVTTAEATPGSVPSVDPVPVTLRIPAIEVGTPLVSLGLQDDRTVEVPADPDRAGWYRLGAAPGSSGAAVILGHVDSVDGPAVFARLSTLRRGDRVEVELDSGRRVTFAVTDVRTYPNAAFPAEQVYRSRNGQHTLNLVTCGGAYDRDAGGYQSNVVVYSRQVRGSGGSTGDAVARG